MAKTKRDWAYISGGSVVAFGLIASGVGDLNYKRVPYSGDPGEQRTQELYDDIVTRPRRNRLLAYAKIALGAVLGSMVAYDALHPVSRPTPTPPATPTPTPPKYFGFE